MIKKILFFTSLCISVVTGYAQKKLTPVSKSVVTGIGLPNGSKQDGRILSVAAAATLLEMEIDKTNTTLQTTEVLVLPPASLYSFTKDSLAQRLSSQSWKIVNTKGDNYLWLQKGNRFVIAYFSVTNRETGIYFAEMISTPTLSSQSPSTNQTTPSVVNTQPVTQTIPVTLEKKDNTISQSTTPETKTQPVNAPAVKSAFTFNTTNFNDGWTSTEQADWVQVTKGNIKILIHYPNKSADEYNSVLMDGLKNAWNILVAPKYSSGSNFEFKPITGWQSIEFAEADMVEKATTKPVHVVLFKINYSNGSGKYMEFITPDKKTYEQEFGPYHQESYGWEKVETMANYNKFAVGPTDLTGKWTSDFSGMIQYVNAYTGANAGANAHSSSQSFEFMADNTYKWEIGVASGMVGNMKFQSAKSAGKFSLPNNWQVYFSELEGKPKTYNAYFSCVKGARLLWLEDSSYATGYTAYGKKE